MLPGLNDQNQFSLYSTDTLVVTNLISYQAAAEHNVPDKRCLVVEPLCTAEFLLALFDCLCVHAGVKASPG